tara:strand:- start:44444 stop:45616 length:1173 start_codon:yes stop_codon:yes gene_type:complete
VFGLYVHYPYCLQRCSYCDFATDLYKNEEKTKDYFSLLKREVLLSSHTLKDKELNSIYFGGGTPSLVPPDIMEDFFSFLLKQGFYWQKSCEISLEINPDTVDEEKLSEYIKIGFNRFSIGIQTFNDDLLKLVGRQHSAKQSRKNLEQLNKLDTNFSCDLLYSLPQQTFQQVLHDVGELISYQPKHFSPYILTIPPRHKLNEKRPGEEEQVKMMEAIKQALENKAYEQYEISNFALKGFHSRHNFHAWRGHSYWGIGMSAHSFFAKPKWGVRFANPNSIKSYAMILDKKKPGLAYQKDHHFVEELRRHEALTDFCHTSLRLRRGIDFHEIDKKFGPDLANLVIQRSKRKNITSFLETTPYGVRLNWHGIVFSNQVFEDFLFLEEDICHLDM